jgi:hypothetical protein
LLVQLSAINGSVLRIARDLPPADTSFALRKRLPQRELIWLPDNTGWVIGMRGLADTESEAVVDIQLPGISAADGSDADVIPAVIEMLPAGNHRLLLLIAAPGEDPSVRQVAGQFLALPELGPFM